MTGWLPYEPGRRVACMEDLSAFAHWFTAVPVKGRVYTIREAFMGSVDLQGNVSLGLTFEEFEAYKTRQCPNGYAEGEIAFSASHFRPLDEQSLEQFRSLLTHKPVEAQVQP